MIFLKTPRIKIILKNKYGEGVVQSELIWKHMELYGSIKNKKGGFPTLNPTLYVLLQFKPLISMIWECIWIMEIGWNQELVNQGLKI